MLVIMLHVIVLYFFGKYIVFLLTNSHLQQYVFYVLLLLAIYFFTDKLSVCIVSFMSYSFKSRVESSYLRHSVAHCCK